MTAPTPTPEEARKSRLIAAYTDGVPLRSLAADEGEPVGVIRADLASWGLRIRGREEARLLAVLRDHPRSQGRHDNMADPTDYQQTDELPAPPCPRCDELDTQQQNAQAAHDKSALVDVNVLRSQHALFARCTRAASTPRAKT
ncbi:hypothetical protein [Kitasatospora kifunensis]|uniref:Uncharacterized protein n=1 Tax=Kitasatospora kifunensis TaxID=58351 RepID=A0A7W7R0R1_KITKI|nr:hypothetical protein [Kitasatospora kifunensis]MBB4922661.1 hypothetical protein [Kitasatospora kifunensis]